jgi:hypothetical protein
MWESGTWGHLHRRSQREWWSSLDRGRWRRLHLYASRRHVSICWDETGTFMYELRIHSGSAKRSGSVASRKVRTSTILGSLRRVGRVHGDGAKGVRSKVTAGPRELFNLPVLTIQDQTMRVGQRGGKERGRAGFFLVRERDKQLWRRE